ncbi:leucyl/phenylalanyl-tRNA--protein transferase [Luminiphilus sp.]|nr:leucyl/phenylalanyl-tRNA--protein transferase [Luminiphilus sp.]
MAPNPFPPTSQALSEPNGLLAHGGDLSPETLLLAYAQGIFPWFHEGQEILWWSPDPRMVLRPSDVHISRSLRRTLRNKDWLIRYDTDFTSVIHCCAKTRQRESTGADTWITGEMLQAYTTLHNLGIAHSIEVFSGGSLVGGLYGLLIGNVFFGESMFHKETDASKAAFTALAKLCVDYGVEVIDCQVYNPHLESLGATLMSRQDFEKALRDAIKQPMASILNNPHCLLPITPMALDVRMQGQVPREVRSLL